MLTFFKVGSKLSKDFRGEKLMVHEVGYFEDLHKYVEVRYEVFYCISNFYF